MAAIEDYELLKPLGGGGHGSVWSARERAGLGREVAIRRLGVIRLDGVARLEREAVLLSHLANPAIVVVRDIVRDGDGFALVTDLAPGGSLADRRADGPMTGVAAVAFGLQVADAVALAHEAAVVHGNIKPSNILLDADDRALVGDFGIARWLSQPPGLAARAAPSDSAGFAAPEVAAGRRPGPHSDVYSLAATVVALIGDGPPQRPGDALDLPISAALGSVLAAALAPSAPDRYPNAASLAKALAATPEGSVYRRRTDPGEGLVGVSPGAQRLKALSPAGGSAFGWGKWTWRWIVVVAAAIAGALTWLAVDEASDSQRVLEGQVAAVVVHS